MYVADLLHWEYWWNSVEFVFFGLFVFGFCAGDIAGIKSLMLYKLVEFHEREIELVQTLQDTQKILEKIFLKVFLNLQRIMRSFEKNDRLDDHFSLFLEIKNKK